MVMVSLLNLIRCHGSYHFCSWLETTDLDNYWFMQFQGIYPFWRASFEG